jgi:hypothetical protein
MKNILIILITLIFSLPTHAQEYKLAKNSGKLIITVPGAIIEGYSGNEIIITKTTSNEPIVVKGYKLKPTSAKGNNQEMTIKGDSISLNSALTPSETKIFPRTFDRKEEEYRSKGLRVISADGLLDNTGLGLHVNDKGSIIEINSVTKLNLQPFLIRIPKGISVSYNTVNSYSPNVIIRNIESEVEVSMTYGGVKVDNVTGPLTINTMYGDIEASLASNVKYPITLLTLNGFIDLSIPASTQANLMMSSKMSDVLVSPDLNFVVMKSENRAFEPDRRAPNKPIEGKLNGGGGEISAKTTNGMIYLRNK